MNKRLWLVILLSWPLVLGCRTDPAVAILERELRRKEDEIYRLRATVEDLQEIAYSCQEQTGAGGEEPRIAPTKAVPRHDSPPEVPHGVAPPKVEVPGAPSGKSLLQSAPLQEAPQSGENPTPAGLAPPRLIPAETAAASTPAGISLLPSGDSRRVAAIVVDRTLTGGLAAEDGSDGDQGLLVVVEPHDSAGRVVDAPAEMSVAVLDPAITDAQGKALRIARWDFSAAEVAGMFRRSPTGPAIYLTMVWPERPPQHSKLRLFVRYITADGRKLLAEAPIEVALSSENAATTSSDNRNPSAYSNSQTDTSNRLGSRRLQWSPERR